MELVSPFVTTWLRVLKRRVPPLLFAALLAGCVDDTSPVGAAPDESLFDASALVGVASADMLIEPRFEIDVDVDGALKPGHPIHLTVRGSARFATKDAEVRLVLPEVAAARRSGWELVEIPVGEELLPHLQMRKGFAARESFRERATVTIPEPGYYFVLATVLQRSEDSLVSGQGHLIGSGASRELWLWIDEHGGRVTERFDPSLFPEGSRGVRGPLGSDRRPPRVRDGDIVITCSVSPDGGFAVASSYCPVFPTDPTAPPPNAMTAVTVTYNDAGSAGTVRPLADAWVAWKVFSTVNGVEVARGGGYTNTSGASGTIDCMGPTSERRLQVTVHTENRKAEVKSYITSNADRTQVGQYLGSCGGSIPITADNQQAHLFMNLSKNWDGHQRFFGTPPTFMKAGLYPTSSYGTRYDWGADHIRIETAIWDHIWGQLGVMVSAHEWAHLWQDQYLYKYPSPDGLKRFYNLACPNPHPIGHYTNFGCAFGEAFADWYGVVVRESDLPGWKQAMEENRFHLFECGQRCTDDGSIVQGAVHAFLWDIVDPGLGEAHDRVEKTPGAVVDAIKHCEVTINHSDWFAYTGIDHLVWCMERRFPYQVRMRKTSGSGDTLQTFFNTRRQDRWVNAASGFTVANLSDDFRRIWLVNLYSKRVNVGTGPVFSSVAPGETLPPPNETQCGEGTSQPICPS